MKQQISPVVTAVVIIVVLLVIGGFLWTRSSRSLPAEEQEKYLTPKQLPAPGQAGSTLPMPPPPPTSTNPMLPPQGNMPAPPPPPR